MDERVRRRVGRTLFLCLLCFLFLSAMTLLAAAATPTSLAPAAPPAGPHDSAVAARPSDGGAPDLAAAVTRLFTPIAPPQPAARQRNGSLALNVRGRFLHVYVMRRDPDGTVAQGCVASPEEALAILEPSSSSPAPSPALEEK